MCKSTIWRCLVYCKWLSMQNFKRRRMGEIWALSSQHSKGDENLLFTSLRETRNNPLFFLCFWSKNLGQTFTQNFIKDWSVETHLFYLTSRCIFQWNNLRVWYGAYNLPFLVVLDRRDDKNCETGRYELAFKQVPFFMIVLLSNKFLFLSSLGRNISRTKWKMFLVDSVG